MKKLYTCIASILMTTMPLNIISLENKPHPAKKIFSATLHTGETLVGLGCLSIGLATVFFTTIISAAALQQMKNRATYSEIIKIRTAPLLIGAIPLLTGIGCCMHGINGLKKDFS